MCHTEDINVKNTSRHILCSRGNHWPLLTTGDHSSTVMNSFPVSVSWYTAVRPSHPLRALISSLLNHFTFKFSTCSVLGVMHSCNNITFVCNAVLQLAYLHNGWIEKNNRLSAFLAFWRGGMSVLQLRYWSWTFEELEMNHSPTIAIPSGALLERHFRLSRDVLTLRKNRLTDEPTETLLLTSHSLVIEWLRSICWVHLILYM